MSSIFPGIGDSINSYHTPTAFKLEEFFRELRVRKKGLSLNQIPFKLAS